jgi:tRNA U38,U39,U40 pseudouridine synthase TruA
MHGKALAQTKEAASMLNTDALPDRNIVVFTPDGPLEAADFARAAQAIDPLMAANGKLAGLMIHTPSFPGWRDFDAVRAHLKFVRDHQRRIDRLAVVTDSAFLKTMAGIAGAFVHPQVRQFGFAEKERALAWLETGR